MAKYDLFKIKGTVFWAHVRKPSPRINKYQLDLSIDEETATLLESKGITLKQEKKTKEDGTKNTNFGTENDRGTYVTLTKAAECADGREMKPPSIEDSKKNVVGTDVLIGNGSVLTVVTHVYDWTFKKKTGKSLGLDAIQINALVEYSNPATDLFEEQEDGYTVDTVGNTTETTDNANDSDLFD